MDFHPINQLYEFTPKIESMTTSGRNPLLFADALDEAEFIDMRISAQRSRAGILCDLRFCYGFEGSNTALVVLTGVGKITWANDDWTRQCPWHARYAGWQPEIHPWTGHPLPPWFGGRDHVWALDAEEPSAASAPTGSDNENELVHEYILDFERLSVSALSAQIYIGHVDGMDGAPPDMTELSDAEIIAGFPQWSSVMGVHEHYVYPEP